MNKNDIRNISKLIPIKEGMEQQPNSISQNAKVLIQLVMLGLALNGGKISEEEFITISKDIVSPHLNDYEREQLDRLG